jgi:hypothetical protein
MSTVGETASPETGLPDPVTRRKLELSGLWKERSFQRLYLQGKVKQNVGLAALKLI